MKSFVLYRPNSEFARTTEQYVRDFERRKGVRLELVNIDTEEGTQKARLYDIVQYPAILVTRDDGQIMKAWQGEPFPLMDEIAGYLDR